MYLQLFHIHYGISERMLPDQGDGKYILSYTDLEGERHPLIELEGLGDMWQMYSTTTGILLDRDQPVEQCELRCNESYRIMAAGLPENDNIFFLLSQPVSQQVRLLTLPAHDLISVGFEYCDITYPLDLLCSTQVLLSIEGGRATLKDDNGAESNGTFVNGKCVTSRQLQVGDVICVRTGSVIPVDGTVTSGEANINEASMTGEPLSVRKAKGSTVFAGTVVDEGSIHVQVRALSGNTKIQKIIELIDNSENLKAGVQSRAENLADRIVPFSFLGFGLTLLLTRNITKAVSILMVDYSCAIKLSTPISVISAIREAADHDITVKGGKYLEAFAEADSVVFDKTGTLTNAEPVLERAISFSDYSEDEILRIAACIEEHFPHSVARAIVKGAADRGLNHQEEHAEVQYIVAHGIATTLHGKRAIIGSHHFVSEDEHVEITAEQQAAIEAQSGGCSVVYLAIGGKLSGVLCISDPPRAEAGEAIGLLKKAGIENVVMLTGDSQKAAEVTAAKLGITKCFAQVLPEDKHRYVEQLKADGHRVIMVGDGINDAPALAAADVSVAMSDASDIAREAADITLRGADLTELATLRTLSEKLMTRIHRNYRFIIGFNSSLLLLGLFGIIAPTTSAFLHNASTMAICARSMTPMLEKKQNSATEEDTGKA